MSSPSQKEDIMNALYEARDINMYLKAMRKHFEDLEEADFADINKMIPPMFHCLCLVWVHCKHYQQPARIVVLLQELSNLMIEIVSSLLCLYMSIT